MNEEYRNVERAVSSLKGFCINHQWCNAAMTIGRVVVSLNTMKNKKWDVNFNDIFLLDNNNYKNLNIVLNYLYATNTSPSQVFGDEFIQSLIKNYKEGKE